MLVDYLVEFLGSAGSGAVGGGFSPRRDGRCGTAASRSKAPSHSPLFHFINMADH